MSLKRALVALATCLLVVPAATVVTAAPAQAASCYGQKFGYVGSAGSIYETPVVYTSTRCVDINLNNSDSSWQLYACVVFVNYTNNCNYGTSFAPGEGWKTIATDVKDGTAFKVRVWGSTNPFGFLFYLAY